MFLLFSHLRPCSQRRVAWLSGGSPRRLRPATVGMGSIALHLLLLERIFRCLTEDTSHDAVQRERVVVEPAMGSAARDLAAASVGVLEAEASLFGKLLCVALYAEDRLL